MTVHFTEAPAQSTSFLNREYVSEYGSAELHNRRYDSCIAYQVEALVSQAWMAHDNETSGSVLDARSVSKALETARAMLGDLIDEIEYLEAQQPKTATKCETQIDG